MNHITAQARHVAVAVLHHLIVAVITLGAVAVAVAEALDALITAAIGTRRLIFLAQQVRDTIRLDLEESR